MALLRNTLSIECPLPAPAASEDHAHAALQQGKPLHSSLAIVKKNMTTMTTARALIVLRSFVLLYRNLDSRCLIFLLQQRKIQ